MTHSIEKNYVNAKIIYIYSIALQCIADELYNASGTGRSLL